MVIMRFSYSFYRSILFLLSAIPTVTAPTPPHVIVPNTLCCSSNPTLPISALARRGASPTPFPCPRALYTDEAMVEQENLRSDTARVCFILTVSDLRKLRLFTVKILCERSHPSVFFPSLSYTVASPVTGFCNRARCCLNIFSFVRFLRVQGSPAWCPTWQQDPLISDLG
jgi:hypothetical protein